jgi:hypothetical protein
MEARERSDPPAEKPFLMILVKRATIFLFAICAMALFFWVVGSESSFLDQTQSMLLSIVRLASLGLVVASGFGILIAVAMAIGRRFGLRLLGIAAYALTGTVGLAALALSQSVSLLSHGLP